MTPAKARELISKVAKVTEKAFRECKGIDPVFHFEGKRGFTSLLIPEEYTPEVKDAASAVIRRALEVDEAKWVMMVSEAWVVHSDTEIEGSLENHPDRREVIYYRLEDTDVPSMEAEQEVIRPKGQNPYLGELKIKNTTSASGRFVGMLPRGRMSS